MKKLLFILGLSVIALTDVFGQQVPLYSQYWQNPFLYNPARTGSDGRYNVYGIYRRQFAGFANGPETRAVTFDMPLQNDKAGIGVYFYNDITNIFKRNAAYFAYAYHIKLAEAHRLSIGLSAGVQHVRIDQDKVVVHDDDDFLLLNQNERNLFFDANVGINYNWKNLNIGISVPQVFGTDIDYLSEQGQSGYSIRRHYLANASYAIKLAQDKFTIEPMAQFRTTEAFNIGFDAGAAFMYKDWVWINAMYRYDYAVTIGGGFKIHDVVKVGYAYDLAINDMKDYHNGSHEIMVGLTFGKRDKKDAAMDSSLIKKLNEQDSLINELRNKVDTLEQNVDSMGSQLDSMQANFADGSTSGIDQEKMDELVNRLNELDQKYKSAIDSLNKQGTNKGKKSNQDELNEERTRIVDENDLEYKRGTVMGDYFMVVGSFRIEQNSYNFEEQLNREGFKPGVVYDKKRKWYYVYLSQPESRQKGFEELYKLREENPRFHDAWIHIMSKSVNK